MHNPLDDVLEKLLPGNGRNDEATQNWEVDRTHRLITIESGVNSMQANLYGQFGPQLLGENAVSVRQEETTEQSELPVSPVADFDKARAAREVIAAIHDGKASYDQKAA